MNTGSVWVQELLAFPHDRHVRIDTKHFALGKKLIGAHGDNRGCFVAMLLDIVVR